MDVKRLLTFIRRWLAILVVATLGAGLAGFLVTKIQDPTRETEAQLLVGPTSGRLDELRAASSVAQTYVELASSTRVLQAAARRADKPVDAAAFRKRLTVRANELTRILSLRVRGKDAREAADLGNALAAELVEMSKPPPAATVAPASPAPADEKKAGGTTAEPVPISLTIVESASPFSASSTASPFVLVLLAATIGLGTSTLTAGLVEVLRDRARDVEDVVEVTGADCIAVPIGRRRARLEQRVRSASAATHVVAALPDATDETPPARIIALCPPGEGHEIADVALGLAATLGAAGNETVIVDVDPRQKLTTALGLRGRTGAVQTSLDYSSATAGPSDESFSRKTIGLPGVTVVPGGSGLLPNTDQAAKVLQRLLNEVDRVLLVTGSPLHDAASLQWTRPADAALLVATAGQSKRSDLAEAAHGLRLAGTKLAGTVLRSSPQVLWPLR